MLKKKEIELIGKTINVVEQNTDVEYCPIHFTKNIKTKYLDEDCHRYGGGYTICGVDNCDRGLLYLTIEISIKILKKYEDKYLCYTTTNIDERIDINFSLQNGYMLHDGDWLLSKYVESLNKKHLDK